MLREEYNKRGTDLKAKYPALFVNSRNMDLSINPGWFDLFEHMCKRLHEELPLQYLKRFKFEQSKEKFGTLRVYCTFISNVQLPDHIYDCNYVPANKQDEMLALGYEPIPSDVIALMNTIVGEAMTKSCTTCDKCGKPAPGLYQIGHWLLTRCEEHARADVKFFDDDQPLSDYQLSRKVTFIGELGN